MSFSQDSIRPAQGRESYSEAALLGMQTADAAWGFNLRLCRYPDDGVSWGWAHVFTPAGRFAWQDHALPCSAGRVGMDDMLTGYALPPPGRLRIERHGSLRAPERCLATACLELGPGTGNGSRPPVPVRIAAEFTPLAAFLGNLQGRAEWPGRVAATLTIGRERVTLEGPGHFHEQVQTAPRFVAPFVYASLGGRGVALIAARGLRGCVGQAWQDGVVRDVNGFEISAPGRVRRLDVSFRDGTRWRGRLRARHRYVVDIYDRPRAGSLVTAALGGRSLSGNVNDWMAEAMPYLA